MPKTERLKRSNVIILNGNIKINTKGICQQSSKWWSLSKEKWRGRSLRLPFFLNLAALVGLFKKILKNDHWAVCGVRLFHEILPIKDCHFKLWLLYIVLLKEAKLRGSPMYKRENKGKESTRWRQRILLAKSHILPSTAQDRLCQGWAKWPSGDPKGMQSYGRGSHSQEMNATQMTSKCTLYPIFSTPETCPFLWGLLPHLVPSLIVQGRASPSVTFFLILLLSHQLALQFFLPHTTQGHYKQCWTAYY